MNAALRQWLDNNSVATARSGVEIESQIPSHDDNVQWKASLGLTLGTIVCQFTVWDRRPYETSVIVFNKDRNETILLSDKTPNSLDDVISELDEVLRSLISGDYGRMKPDRRLFIR